MYGDKLLDAKGYDSCLGDGGEGQREWALKGWSHRARVRADLKSEPEESEMRTHSQIPAWLITWTPQGLPKVLPVYTQSSLIPCIIPSIWMSKLQPLSYINCPLVTFLPLDNYTWICFQPHHNGVYRSLFSPPLLTMTLTSTSSCSMPWNATGGQPKPNLQVKYL